jgi:hypothetical protein
VQHVSAVEGIPAIVDLIGRALRGSRSLDEFYKDHVRRKNGGEVIKIEELFERRSGKGSIFIYYLTIIMALIFLIP